MTDQPTLAVTTRARVGSHTSRQLRRRGQVPAVLYGHGAEPLPVLLDATEFRHTVASSHYGSQMVMLQLDGHEAGMALVKAVQLDTLHRQVLAVDLQRVHMDERVQVSVPIMLVGELAPSGAALEHMLHAINLRCGASDVPTELQFDISTLEIGEVLRVSQFPLPPGAELLDDPQETVAIVAAPSLPVLGQAQVPISESAGPELTGEAQQESAPGVRTPGEQAA